MGGKIFGQEEEPAPPREVRASEGCPESVMALVQMRFRELCAFSATLEITLVTDRTLDDIPHMLTMCYRVL